ncbi:glucoamylase family protein [Empedobacter falsenii]|uniref:glucoamylase family protein n=1 Tax=Empedobacter falsenii TaxID=343874 RepID=UPI001C565767|nr:glucoamylase family protein [Empedobacter falsenii]MBW1618721.1 beta-glucosidase [Empedobacter falsenii]
MIKLNKTIVTCAFLCGASAFAQTKQENKLLDKVQKQTIQYFWDYAEPHSKLARERFHPDGFYPENDSNIITTGGTGFGLMSLIVGIDREFIPRKEATERILTGLKFLQNADRFHGAWPHWLNGETGKVKAFSTYDNGGDLVETAFLAQGLICLKEYFKDSKNEKEIEISQLADQLWKEIDFNFYTRGENVLYWHWSPNYEWKINFPLKGFDETMITYVIAAASPKHSINSEVYYSGWTRNGDIKSNDSAYGVPLIVKHNGANKNVGPLFWAQYSFIGLNPNNLIDGIGIDYGKVVKNQAKIHYIYNQQKKESFKKYKKNMWGLTASYTFNPDGTEGYTAHSPLNDNNVITPTAALSSFPYTPKESMDFLKFIYEKQNKSLIGVAGPYDAVDVKNDRVITKYLAIDQGTITPMIENYRSGLLWKLFMQNEDVQRGLDKLKFKTTASN